MGAMTDITTNADRAVLARRLGDLSVTVMATDDPRAIEAETVIDGQRRVVGVKHEHVIPESGPIRDGIMDMVGRWFADLRAGKL